MREQEERSDAFAQHIAVPPIAQTRSRASTADAFATARKIRFDDSDLQKAVDSHCAHATQMEGVCSHRGRSRADPACLADDQAFRNPVNGVSACVFDPYSMSSTSTASPETGSKKMWCPKVRT